MLFTCIQTIWARQTDFGTLNVAIQVIIDSRLVRLFLFLLYGDCLEAFTFGIDNVVRQIMFYLLQSQVALYITFFLLLL